MTEVLRRHSLHTICEEGHCPNIGECWGQGVATIMIAGSVCTRGCAFCAVPSGRPDPLDPTESARVAAAVKEMNPSRLVLAMVNRDDLPDAGAAHFAETVRSVKSQVPACAIEALIPDLGGRWEALKTILDSDISVLNHPVQTVPRLFKKVRPGADYERSLELLHRAHKERRDLDVQSGLMLGLGEEQDEIDEVLNDLRRVGCTVLSLGQYLPPSSEHYPLSRYVHPDEFKLLEETACEIGFRRVEAGPLVRMSCHKNTDTP